MNTKRREFLAGLATMGATALVRPPLGLAQQAKPRTILLAHGLLGFSKISRLRYFNRVRGCFDNASFIEPGVAPAGSIRERAQQLETAITKKVPQKELDQGGTIHIVAHSMGGLVARYLISSSGLRHAKWIASLTTISRPHQGSPLADIIMGHGSLSPGDFLRVANVVSTDTILSVLRSLGKPAPAGIPLSVFAPAAIFEGLGDIKNYAANLFGTPPDAFSELTTGSTTAFNSAHPSLENVPSFSWVGISSPDQTMCRGLFASWIALKLSAGDNDGVVPASSSSWSERVPKIGTGNVAADHLEEVGLGALPVFDGPPARSHFPVCNLYQKINAWQKTLPSS